MKTIEENTNQSYIQTAEAPAKQSSSFIPTPAWIFGVFMVLLCILCALFAYQKPPSNPNIATIPETIINKSPKIFTKKIIIQKGATIGKILSSYNLSYQEINKILKISSLKKVNLERLRPKQTLRIQYITDDSQQKIFKNFTIAINAKSKLQILFDQKTNDFQASIVPVTLIKKIISFENKIKNSLITAALNAGVPMSHLIEATKASSYAIDFQRDIKKGDSFKILLEKFTSPEDGSSFFGKTLYFSLNLNKKQYEIYKFKPKNGQEEFFTGKYHTAKLGLLRTPVPVFRISGRFGPRKHPILGYSLMHKGVDFAAPLGTPIYAAGDGVIATMSRNNGFGNYIKIKHNGKLTTVYGHISKFAKKLKRGVRVKQGQIIAFVGKTGRATGPHLHYEVHVNGRHVNPLKFKLPSAKSLKGKDLEKFKNYKTYIKSLLKNPLSA